MVTVIRIIRTRVCVPRWLAAATIQGQRLSCLRASDCAATIWGRRLFEGGYYLRAATIRWRRLFEGGDYSRVATIRGWQLFEGGDYSRAVTIRGWQLFKEIWYMYVFELYIVHVCCNAEVPTVKDSSFLLLQGANILLTDSGDVKLGECAYCNVHSFCVLCFV